ncbi:hypothetical protein [Amycolatopsis sp. CA-230715]|uniref:hypothetical protein n=1 Tax=Amycolatopsis sp. CA-230715 TaxID=2745196 RepID=UPI001C02A28E|nr:hypothetical protein [Amycolatopsis sp. CA-230715]QWF83798.1 hypothetical protein HUW46_07241 [Amycolatopsis sp. CA-230715]
MTASVGHGSVVVDVPAGTAMGGYAARTGGSTGTLDPIEVHAFTVSDGERRFLWLVGDLPAVNTDLAAALVGRLAGPHRTDPELVWFGATHTHAAPDVGCRPGGGRTPREWAPVLLAAGERAAELAVAAEAPVDLTVHKGLLTGVGGQRSGPRPRSDVPVTVLAARRGAAVLGAVVVLPVHPTVLGADNLLASADLAGAARRALAARTGGWAVVATGAAGDVSTRAHRRAQTPDEVHRLGELAADQLVAILGEPGVPVDIGPDSLAGFRTWPLPLPDRTAEPGPDLDALRARLEVVLGAGDPVAVREAETAVQGAELAATARVRGTGVVVGVVRLGGLRLVSMGAEPYLALEAAVAAGLPGPAALVGYTNGYLGYLPTRTAYGTGVYEVNISPVAEGAAELAVAEAIRLGGVVRR